MKTLEGLIFTACREMLALAHLIDLFLNSCHGSVPSQMVPSASEFSAAERKGGSEVKRHSQPGGEAELTCPTQVVSLANQWHGRSGLLSKLAEGAYKG